MKYFVQNHGYMVVAEFASASGTVKVAVKNSFDTNSVSWKLGKHKKKNQYFAWLLTDVQPHLKGQKRRGISNRISYHGVQRLHLFDKKTI